MALGARSKLFASTILLYLAIFLTSAVYLRYRLVGGLSEEAIATVDRHLAVAFVLGLLVSIVVAVAASRAMSRTLRDLVISARKITKGIGHPIDTRQDELAGLAGSLTVMAEHLQYRDSKRLDEKARFRAVLEGMGEAVIALDTDRRITLMNAAAHELIGNKEDLRGRSLLEIIRTPALQTLLANDEKRAMVEFNLPSTERIVQTTQTQAKGGGRVLVLHDVTELRRLETIRRDFVANVSHELRTPVSIVRANLETLLDGAFDDKVHGPKLAKAALKNAERLKNIINDLLDLSRLEAGRFDVASDGVLVIEAINRATDSVSRPVGVRVDDESLEVYGDPQAIDQVLLNLLDNAAKYTPQDADISVSATAHDDRVRIAVADTGHGIEPRLRERVFERFYRVDPGRSREMGGTGLGLAIVKHLVENMGGRVGLDANDPRGSVFWFELKRKQEA